MEQTPDLEKDAAKQLLAEFLMIKHTAARAPVITGMLLTDVRRALRGTMSKYNACGYLVDEKIEVTVYKPSKRPVLVYKITPNLNALFTEIANEIQPPVEKKDDAV